MKMNNSEKSQKLEVMLKSYELVEMAIQNHIQKIGTIATGFVAILSVIIGLIATYVSIEGFNFQKLSEIKFLFLFIPIFIVLIYAYLINHKRTLIFDSAYARYMEKRINELTGSGKTIYFETLSYPLIKHETSMDTFIDIFLFLSYGAFLYFIVLIGSLEHYFVLYYFFIGFIAVYFAVFPRWTLEKWSNEVEKWIENEEPDISKLGDLSLFWGKFKRKVINKLLSKLGFKP